MWDHIKKMDDRQRILVQRYNYTKEEYQKTEGRRQKNTKFENENISCCIKDIEYKFTSIEELGGRIQDDIAEIHNTKDGLVTWNKQIEQKCKKEIRNSENEYLSKENMSKLNDLCAQLERWNKEYGHFEEEHFQWIKKKSELEEKGRKTEQNMDVREKKKVNIEESIICLNRMIDVEEKMKELRKLMDELIDLETEKKDIYFIQAKIIEKIEEYKRNNKKLDDVQKDLQRIRNLQERKCKMPASNYLSDVATFKRNEYKKWGRKANGFQIKLAGPSDFKEKIEGRTLHIEETHAEVKWKHEKLTGPDCTHHMKEYLDKIENLCREIDGCNLDVRKTISDWKTEIDIFEKNSKTAEDKMKNRKNFLSKMEKQVSSIKFILDPLNFMIENQKRVANCYSQKQNGQKHWDTYMSDHGHKFDIFSTMSIDHKNELIEILNGNRKYMFGLEKLQHNCDDSEQQCGRGVVTSFGDVEQTKRDVEHMKTTWQMNKTAHQLHQKMDETIKQLNKEKNVLWNAINKQYPKLQSRIRIQKNLMGYDEYNKVPIIDLSGELEEINHLLEKMEKVEEVVQQETEAIQNWHNSMLKVEEEAEALTLNPFNISLDCFHKIRDECITLVNEHEDRAEDHGLKWKDHVKEKKLLHKENGQNKEMDKLNTI